MTDYETTVTITNKSGEDAIDKMISDSSNSNNRDLFKSTFSTTEIAKECHQVSTANQLNYILKNMNILLSNGNLSQSSIDEELGIIFQGQNKTDKRAYLQIRWTQKGKKYIKEILNQEEVSKNNNLKIVDRVEVKFTNYEYDDSVIHICCTVKNEEMCYYELNQKIKDRNTADNLVKKIKNKGLIDLRYWTSEHIDALTDYDDDDIYIPSDDDNYNEPNYEDDEYGTTNGKVYLSGGVYIDRKDVWW